MAILRSGKITKIVKNPKRKPKKNVKIYNLKSARIVLKKLSVDEINSLCNPRYNFRSRAVKSPVIEQRAVVAKTKRNENHQTIQLVSSNMWKDLLNKNNSILRSGVYVMAKMESYRPWPARINSIYSVNKELKCFVMFFGTFQIGSVSMKNCVCFSDCGEYLLNEINQLKAKYKWGKNTTN